MKQATSNIQTISQEQRQQLSAVQLLASQLTALSVEELRNRIDTECNENPWLERKEGADDDGYNEAGEEYAGTDEYSNSEDEGEDSTLDINDTTGGNDEDWGGDEFPQAAGSEDNYTRERGDEPTFHDLLMSQMGEYDLNEHQQVLLEFLIGSLDDDGLLHVPLFQVCDELHIYHNIQTTEQELEELLTRYLHEFEPYGVGARDLIECLLIQVRHRTDLPMRKQMLTLFEKYGDEFKKNHWDIIQRRMKLTDAELSAMRHALKHLNPRPGGSVGRSSEESAHIIVPDFEVKTDNNGEIHFQLYEQGIPQLQMSEDLAEWMDAYGKEDLASARQDVLEAIKYKRNLWNNGALFIKALAQRRQSLITVMRSIVRRQMAFFQEGDETLLRPMTMTEIADETGLDVSTVSRVCQSKSVQTPFGTLPLRWFFTTGAIKDNNDVSIRNLLSALKNLIDEEDKHAPLSDDKLTEKLQEQGYAVARRTVAKYREQLNIPSTRLRKR